MKMKRFLSLFLTLILLLSFTGCGKVKYKATMYSNVNDLVYATFLAENRVGGYGVEEKTFIIEDKETYDLIFIEDSLDVDFDSEVVYLYIFFDCYTREYYLYDITMKEEAVTIRYYMLPSIKNGTIRGYDRCMAVKAKKTGATRVVFNEKISRIL